MKWQFPIIFPLWTIAIALFSTSCETRKGADANAVSEPSASPAAYPAGEGTSSSASESGSSYPSYTGTNSSTSSNTAAAPAPKPSAPSKPAFQLADGEELVSYQIASGDTLGGIASKYGTSVSRIQAANGMSSTRIYAGKTLKIPSRKLIPSTLTTTSATSPAIASNSTGSTRYRTTNPVPTASTSTSIFPKPEAPRSVSTTPASASTVPSSPPPSGYFGPANTSTLPKPSEPSVPTVVTPNQSSSAFPTPSIR